MMKAKQTHLAKDVYSKWKKRITEAEHSIVLFTPFFDELLLKLLKHTQLDKEHIVIVTDFNPESLLTQPKQAKTLKQLLANGFIVLHADRLHAKVLLTDDQFITLGSQNFTSYARKSKECTTVPNEHFKTGIFLTTRLQWKEEAQPVDEAFVDLILSELSDHIDQYKP